MPDTGSSLHVKYGTEAAYNALSSSDRDANAIYFLTDSGKIVVDGVYYNNATFDYVGHYNTVSAIPAVSNVTGKVVSIGSNNNLYRYDGTTWVQLNKTDLTLSSSSPDPVANSTVTTEFGKVFYRDHVTPMIVAIDANNHRIMNVADSSSSSDGRDAANLNYVNANTTDKVKLDGTTPMTGDLNMNSHKITGLSLPTNGTDAASKNYVDTHSGGGGSISIISSVDPNDTTHAVASKGIADYVQGNLDTKLSLTGTVSGHEMTGSIDMGGSNTITNLRSPSLTSDAATKNYVDTAISSIPATTQVQSDWDEADPTDVSYIQNKPNLSTVATSGDYSDLLNAPTLATVATTGDYDDLVNLPTIPAAQVQSNWNESDPTVVSYIQNKPAISSVLYSDATGTAVGSSFNISLSSLTQFRLYLVTVKYSSDAYDVIATVQEGTSIVVSGSNSFPFTSTTSEASMTIEYINSVYKVTVLAPTSIGSHDAAVVRLIGLL